MINPKKTVLLLPSPKPSLDLDFSRNCNIGEVTASRGTTGIVVNQEGLNKTAQVNEVRFQGARRVENLVTNTDFSTGWTNSASTLVTGIADPFGGNTGLRLTATSATGEVWKTINIPTTGHSFQTSAWIRRVSGTGPIRLYAAGSTSWITLTSEVTSTYKRFCSGVLARNTTVIFDIAAMTSGDVIEIAGPLIEDVTGQANTAPSEYVSVGVLSAPWQGAGRDGVQYFTTTNGNTVASNVVTEAAGTPLTTTITLLGEEVRANDFTYSEQIDNAIWSFNNNTITANAAVAPDGTSTADKNIPNAVNSFHRGQQTISVTSGTTYTVSFFVKAAGYNYVQLFTNTGFDATNSWVNFDLTNGTVGYVGPGTFTYSIVPLANSWYRISSTAAATSTSGTGSIAIAVLNANTNSRANLAIFSGNTTSGIYMWGAQWEAASNASSYIPTTTVAVPRAADVASFTGAGLSWYNAQQGTFAITASGQAFRTPSPFGAFNLTLPTAGTYALQYNNAVSDGSTYLYTAAGGATPTEYTGIAVPTTILLLNGGLVNISNFTYYASALPTATIVGMLT